MANPRSGSSATSNNYNLLTNNEKFIKNKKVKIDLLNQARKSVFETLNLDETLVNRTTVANKIWNRRKDPLKVPAGKMELRLEEPKFEVNLDERLNKHTDLKIRYEAAVNKGDTDALKSLDTEFAQRLILDVGGSIEFKPKDKENFIRGKDAKEESEIAFNSLNILTEYTGKIELVTRFLDSGDAKGDNYYVIKWKKEWIKDVIKKYNELLKAEEDNENKEGKNKEGGNKEGENNHEGNDKDKEIEAWKQKYEELLAKAKNEKGNEDADEKNTEKTETENEKMKKMEALIKELMEDWKEKGRGIGELENLVKGGGKDNKAEDKGNEEKTHEEKADVAKPQTVITEDDEIEVENEEEVDEEDDEDFIDEKEADEKNSNFISRKSVEESVLKLRRTLGYPSGMIEIRGEKINIEEFEFYEEIKLKYIEAKGDDLRLSELDKEFAELVILFSPVGSDVKDRYTIKLTEEELDRGLYVSEEFLARYGLKVNIHNYYEKIIEREYKERVEIIERIETEIQTLSTIIIELTRKINIEGASYEEILQQISIKKNRINKLKEKLAKSLLSLRSGNGKLDNELLALKKRLEEVEKGLSELRKQKKHQDEVNQSISKLEEEISSLERHDVDRSKIRKQVEKEFFNKVAIANRNQFADSISKNRNDNGVNGKNIGIPGGNVEITANPFKTVTINLDSYGMKSKYEDLIDEIHDLGKNYKGNKNRIGEAEKKLRELDSMLAERITLDEGLAIEFKTSDEKNFESKRNAKDERDVAYKKLNDLPQYKGKLRRGYTEKIGEKYYYIFMITDQQKAGIEKEVEKRLKDMQNGNSSERLRALKDKLKKLKEEQVGFNEDIDKKIAGKEKELADLQNKIKEKEANNKKRIVVENFDDGDEGAYFHNFCEENGIKRKDGKEIPLTRGMDTSAIYVDKDGRELRLERVDKGAHDDGYDNPVENKYELVYYEKSGEGELSEVEIRLEALIDEQENLLRKLTELEKKLKIASSKGEKIDIEKKIEIISGELTTIQQKITELKTIITSYEQTIKIRRYRVYSVTPVIIPTDNDKLELNAVISDMGTDVFREKAALKVEEEIKRQYDGLGRWQMGSRLALFLGRGSKRKKMMKNEMNNMANTAFQTGAGYATLNDQSQNAADRHGHELLTSMAAVNRITTVHNPQIDQLCKDYLNNVVNDATFQQRFNAIVAADPNIQSTLRGNNITHIGTNILLQLRERKAFKILVNNLDGQLSQYIATGNQVHMHNMQNFVEQYIKDYQKLPAFKSVFEQFLSNPNTKNVLERELAHQQSIMNMQITNLRMNIDILNNGKSAYQIDNKDREKGWKYKVGHFLDKHPWGTAIGSAALAVGLGVATAGASAVAGAAITTGVFGSYVGFTNYIKKWTHHTKEQNTHEKNVVTDYRNEQAKIQNWQNTALNGRGRKKYKAKRQLALYDQTTQENIQLSNQIAEYITNLSAKSGPLTPRETNEYNFMQLNLIEGWARLKYYREIGHNFLASENVDKTEKDMRRLEKAITLGLQKIGKTTNDIEQNMTATNSLGTNITYDVIKNDLKASYDKSLIQFKRERRWLALRYGIGTAALSIGTALGLQWVTHSGVFVGKGTPATPPSTTSYSSGTDNFALGKYDLPGTASYADSGNIYSATKSVLSNPSIPDGSHAVINYGVGTDIVPVRAGHLTTSELQAQLDTVRDNINAMSWGRRTAQRDSFLAELARLRSSGFTNDNLATMRAAEELEHYAQGWADSGKNVVIDGFKRVLDHSGTTYDSLAERFMTGAIEITTPGKPGTDPVKRGRWIMGVPLFFNTFKKRKSSKDTTDQNFGNNNQNGQQNP